MMAFRAAPAQQPQINHEHSQPDHAQHLDSLEEAEKTNMRMLSTCVSSSVSSERTTFLIQDERPVDLLTFRKIFSRLQEQAAVADAPDQARAPSKGATGQSDQRSSTDSSEKKLPFEDFQRAFERLFFLLEDPDEFDAGRYDANKDGKVDWTEFFAVYRSSDISIRLSWCEKIYLTMDNPESSTLAMIISSLVLAAILVSSLCFILSTEPEFMKYYSDGRKPTPLDEFVKVDMVCLSVFVVEYVLRLGTCWGVRSEIIDRIRFVELVAGFDPIERPSKSYRVLEFLIHPSNIIDLAAILPGVIGIFAHNEGGGFVVLRLIRLTRIFRVFRNPAFAQPVAVMSRTVSSSIKALCVLLFQLLLGLAIFGSLMYLCEGQRTWDRELQKYVRTTKTVWNSATREWDDVLGITPFESIPHSFWWAVVTIFTVGYGDEYPTTPTGYCVAVGTMLFGLLILALPVGVIGGNFERSWLQVQEEKQAETETRENYVQEITRSWTRLDPPRMSKIMLLEVWNDRGDESHNAGTPQQGQRPANCFMGEARIDLQLPDDRPVTVKETCILQKNREIVNRPVTGQVNIEYHWTPAHPDCWEDYDDDDEDDNASHTTSARFQLQGNLRVKVMSATDLINLEFTRNDSASSPYCVLMVYPKSPEVNGNALRPLAWRTETARNNLNPSWNAQRVFEYKWTRPLQPKETKSQEAATGRMSKDLGAIAEGPAAQDEPDDESLLDLFILFEQEMAETKKELKTLHERVGKLPPVGGLRDAGRSESQIVSELS